MYEIGCSEISVIPGQGKKCFFTWIFRLYCFISISSRWPRLFPQQQRVVQSTISDPQVHPTIPCGFSCSHSLLIGWRLQHSPLIGGGSERKPVALHLKTGLEVLLSWPVNIKDSSSPADIATCTEWNIKWSRSCSTITIVSDVDTSRVRRGGQ